MTDALPLENQGAVKEVWMVHVRVCALDGGAEFVALMVQLMIGNRQLDCFIERQNEE